MSKPMSEEAQRLLSNAMRYEDSPYVITAARDHKRPMSKGVYYHAWVTIAKRAGLAHVGTHGIRHRSATDIANSGVPITAGCYAGTRSSEFPAAPTCGILPSFADGRPRRLN